VGEKELGEGTVSVRRQGEGDKGSMKIEAFRDLILEEVKRQLDYLEKRDN
jgi:threonyl-tRNA synthetase